MHFNVTLLVEIQDKEFTSHKANSALQFGTNNYMIGLSLTFKSIKQKNFPTLWTDFIFDVLKSFLYSHQY